MTSTKGDMSGWGIRQAFTNECCTVGDQNGMDNIRCEFVGAGEYGGVIDWWPEYFIRNGCAPTRNVRFGIRVKYTHPLNSGGTSTPNLTIIGVVDEGGAGPYHDASQITLARLEPIKTYGAGVGTVTDEVSVLLPSISEGRDPLFEADHGPVINLKLKFIYSRELYVGEVGQITRTVITGTGFNGYVCGARNSDLYNPPFIPTCPDPEDYTWCLDTYDPFSCPPQPDANKEDNPCGPFGTIAYFTAGDITFEFCDAEGCP